MNREELREPTEFLRRFSEAFNGQSEYLSWAARYIRRRWNHDFERVLQHPEYFRRFARRFLFAPAGDRKFYDSLPSAPGYKWCFTSGVPELWERGFEEYFRDYLVDMPESLIALLDYTVNVEKYDQPWDFFDVVDTFYRMLELWEELLPFYQAYLECLDGHSGELDPQFWDRVLSRVREMVDITKYLKAKRQGKKLTKKFLQNNGGKFVGVINKVEVVKVGKKHLRETIEITVNGMVWTPRYIDEVMPLIKAFSPETDRWVNKKIVVKYDESRGLIVAEPTK